jgi:hypothetical protein
MGETCKISRPVRLYRTYVEKLALDGADSLKVVLYVVVDVILRVGSVTKDFDFCYC